MKKFKQAVYWIAINGAMAFLLYLGKFHNEPLPWAWNIFAFWFWFTTIISCGLFATAKKPGENRERLKNPSVPVWLDVSYDVVMICALAALGSFVYATGWTFQVFMLQAARTAAKKQSCPRSRPSP
jgi:hypothetical protein